jgi:ATP-dependent exoDNAse (exonuclease V) beta subunit
LDTGYGETIYGWAKRLAASCDARDLSRLQQLVELAYDYQPRSTLRTSDFIRLVEQTRIADPSSSEVRVMTIHQAKGLQFDAVVLPELTVPLAGQRGAFVAGRPAPDGPFHVVCRLANENVRKFLPRELQALFEDHTRREVTESLCLLYVALTRAVHALEMILPPAWASERSLPKTFGGLLRATLAGGKPATGGQVLYERGDPNWWKTLPAHAAAAMPRDGRSPAPQPIKLAQPLSRRNRGLSRTSPSKLEGGQRISGAQILRDAPADALNAGTLIHAWLESIEWLDDGLPGDERLRAIASALRPQIGDLSQHLDGLIARFRQQLAAPAISAALQRSHYGQRETNEPPRVLRERKFLVRAGDELLSGSIDRLVVLGRGGQIRGAEILDFKTDDLPFDDSAAITARTDFYRPQIEAYRAAAATFLNLDRQRITARLIFLTVGAVREL